MLKRTISLILALVMVAGMMPVRTYAQEAEIPETTVPETTAAPADTEEPEDLEDYEDYDTEEIETLPESVVPPVGAGLFSDKAHAYILYSVKDMTDYLLLLEEDGEYYLYYREGAQDPLAPDSDDE